MLETRLSPRVAEKAVLWYLLRKSPNHVPLQTLLDETNLPISKTDYSQVLLGLMVNGEIYRQGEQEYQISGKGKKRLSG